MADNEKISLDLTPFVALTVLSLASIFENKLPENDKIRGAISDYRKACVDCMSMDDIENAFLEKELYEILINLNTPNK